MRIFPIIEMFIRKNNMQKKSMEKLSTFFFTQIVAPKHGLNLFLDMNWLLSCKRPPVSWITSLLECVQNPDDQYPVSPANLITFKDTPNPPSIYQFSEHDVLACGHKRGVDYSTYQSGSGLDGSVSIFKTWKKMPNHMITFWNVRLLKGKSEKNDWPMGLVVEVKVREDGLVRRVEVRLGSKEQRKKKGNTCDETESSKRVTDHSRGINALH